jgi:hypothetical protein
METAVNKEYAASSSAQKIGAQASAHFAWIKAGASTEKETDESEAAFREGSSFSTSVVGGDPTDLQDWAAWEKTFYAAPAMIALTLQPLSELVEGINATLASNLDKAVAEYAGGAAALCAAESDQIRALNDQVAVLNDQVAVLSGISKCFRYETELQGKGWTCMTKNSIDGPPEIPRFTADDKSYHFTSGPGGQAECEASSVCKRS